MGLISPSKLPDLTISLNLLRITLGGLTARRKGLWHVVEELLYNSV